MKSHRLANTVKCRLRKDNGDCANKELPYSDVYSCFGLRDAGKCLGPVKLCPHCHGTGAYSTKRKPAKKRKQS